MQDNQWARIWKRPKNWQDHEYEWPLWYSPEKKLRLDDKEHAEKADKSEDKVDFMDSFTVIDRLEQVHDDWASVEERVSDSDGYVSNWWHK